MHKPSELELLRDNLHAIPVADKAKLKPETTPVQIHIEPQARSEDEDAIAVSAQKRW